MDPNTPREDRVIAWGQPVHSVVMLWLGCGVEDIFGHSRGWFCHRIVAYWWVTAKHRRSVFGTDRTGVGFMLLSTRPS